MSQLTQLSTVQFHNQTLITFEQDNVQYVAMKPICENIGLQWESQYNRIKRDEVLSQGTVIITAPTNGGEQQMLCLPIEYLNGWLFGIDVKRVKPEIRDLLITYKKECYKALADYWMKGKAERQQLALPEPEKTFNLETTESTARDLIWALFATAQMHTLLGNLEPALQAIGSNFHPMVYSHHREYAPQIKTAVDFMKQLIQPFKESNDLDWQRLVHNLKRIEAEQLNAQQKRAKHLPYRHF